METFTDVGTTTWVAPVGVTSVDYLAVGGGGGGGNGYDSGGGAGGGGGMVRTGTLSVTPGQSYTITVGAGGTGGADTRANNNGTTGGNSVFGSITSLGGGYGGGSRTNNPGPAGTGAGLGGAAQVGNTTSATGGNGGGGGNSGGGGGGAGGAGTNRTNASTPGVGGAGVVSSISGSSVTYGVGGNGGTANVNNNDGAIGAANTGNGGGGGSATGSNSGGGGNGGSGIVIIKLSQNIVEDNLFMHLDASTYTSGSWSDLTGNGNNATINGATWSSTDGGIFDLDGSNDTIQIPHTSSLSLSTSASRTIQVWVKFDALGDLNQQIPVFGKLSSGFSFDGYWGGLFSNGGVVRCVTNGTGSQTISNSTLTVTTNTWYLFTFISRITSTSGSTKVYINETEYISTSHGTDGYSESNPLYLGWIGSGVSSLYLNGKIGACYFYTDGLTPDEISNNFNSTKSRFGL